MEKNICKIYKTRPNICRVDKMFYIKYNKYFSKSEFYRLNAKACNKLQKQYNLDIKYKLDIGE